MASANQNEVACWQCVKCPQCYQNTHLFQCMAMAPRPQGMPRLQRMFPVVTSPGNGLCKLFPKCEFVQFSINTGHLCAPSWNPISFALVNCIVQTSRKLFQLGLENTRKQKELIQLNKMLWIYLFHCTTFLFTSLNFIYDPLCQKLMRGQVDRDLSRSSTLLWVSFLDSFRLICFFKECRNVFCPNFVPFFGCMRSSTSSWTL